MKNLSHATLLAIAICLPVAAQNTRVEVGKHLRKIPRSCEAVTPAAINGTIDIPALVKEAICKGSGDMLAEYTYTVNAVTRRKDSKGKSDSVTYEVFIPTLKRGVGARGVVVVTHRNGVPVPPAELEKERSRAAERLEKAEEKIARETPSPQEANADTRTGMLPLGMYTQTGVTRESFGVRRGGATLAVVTFLRHSDLTLVRREQLNGRDTLVFSFTPRPNAPFNENQKYMAQLAGEIWIDVTDRIVTKLIGWPAAVSADNKNRSDVVPGPHTPAVYVEMMRLPQQGIWLPHVIRINGADHPRLFDGITTESTSTYSNYVRFSTEVKDVEVGTPKGP